MDHVGDSWKKEYIDKTRTHVRGAIAAGNDIMSWFSVEATSGCPPLSGRPYGATRHWPRPAVSTFEWRVTQYRQLGPIGAGLIFSAKG